MLNLQYCSVAYAGDSGTLVDLRSLSSEALASTVYC